ncbi:hypothetical protein CRYUN_Cryun32bG0056500 [Craigia yunnanensis]
MEDASCKFDTLSSSPDSKNTNNSEENGFNSKLCEYSESPSHAMVDEMRSLDHALPLESAQSIHSPSPSSRKEHDCSIVPDASKTKTVTENESKSGTANDASESGKPDSYGNTYFKGMTSKRKDSSLECVETENVNPKQIYMDASCEDNGKHLSQRHLMNYIFGSHCDPNLEIFMEFGSNISF